MSDQDLSLLLQTARSCEEHLSRIRLYTGWLLALVVVPLLISIVMFLGTCAAV